MSKAKAKLSEVNVKIGGPDLLVVEGKWRADESEQQAAWEMYVELVTRISVAELGRDEGLLREALSSLHSLFETTRGILRSYGPGVARPKRKGGLSFGYIAVAVLNTALRPLLAKWHPELLNYENARPNDISPLEHERAWEHHDTLRQELAKIRLCLTQYANLLGQVAGVQPLVPDTDAQPKEQ